MFRRAALLILSAFLAGAVGLVALHDDGSAAAANKRAEVECIDEPIGTAYEWTVIVHGDMIQSNTDSEGRIAVGGNATLTNFGVASHLPVDGSRVDLAVGGDLKATNVGVSNGSVTYGDELDGSPSAPNGTVTKKALNLDAPFQEAQRRSDGWAAVEANSEITGPEYGALYLTGTDQQLNVFQIDAARLEKAQRILLRVPVGASALINVRGQSYDTSSYPTVSVEFWNGSSYEQFGDTAPSAEFERLRRSLLWNFPEATAVQIGPNLAWQGSVLAPEAAFEFPGNTQLNGTIMVGSLRGDGESHYHPLDEICLPDPGPEPPDPPAPPPPAPEPQPEPEPEPNEPGGGGEGSGGNKGGGGGKGGGGNTSGGGEVPSFGVESEEASSLPGAGRRTHFNVTKEVLNANGKPVELLKTRPGALVHFRLFGWNMGFVGARGVVACDRVPAGLEFVKAPGGPKLRNGKLCWHLGGVNTQREAVVTFRVRGTVCGRVVNHLVVTADNAPSARASAQLTACRREPPDQTG